MLGNAYWGEIVTRSKSMSRHKDNEAEINEQATSPSCFPPASAPSARILILGSFPGVTSLEKQQYYAYPRNSFWNILLSLFDLSDSLAYADRIAALIQRNIALWDVLYSCSRLGSLDSAIESRTIVVNDFSTFFTAHPLIKAIFFNGSRAETEFIKKVAPDVNLKHIMLHKLPSTSPAMAALTIDQKQEAWRIIRNYI